MKKFTFSMQPVLNVKYAAEDLVKHELSEAQKSFVTAQGELELLRQGLDQACLQQTETAASQMLHMHYYQEKLKSEIEKQCEVVLLHQENIRKKQNKVIQAEQERKVIEKLKENQTSIYRQQELAEEQKFLDEIAILSYARNYEEE